MQAARAGGTAGDRLFRLLIGALILASAAAQFALVPVMPVYARRLGLSGFEQGMVLGATGLASLAVSVPAGTLADRLGARRITLAAASAGPQGAGLGAAVGLLNGIWAATAVIGPLAVGLAAEHFGPRAAFGLTQAACTAALAVTAVMAWRTKDPGRAADGLSEAAGPGWSPTPDPGRTRSRSARPS